MSQLHAFVIVATILIGFLGAIWKMDDRFNIFVRAILFFLTVWGVMLLVVWNTLK